MANKKTKTTKERATWNEFKKAFEEAYGVQPTSVHGLPTLRTYFYRTQLERILFSIIDVEYNTDTNTWDEDYIREGVLLNGLLTVTNDDNGTLLPLKCGPEGVNVFNRPTGIVVANPVVGSFTRTIGVDCEIIYLQSKMGGRYRNFRSTLDVYSQKLANCDCAIDVNIFNTRTPYIFQAPNQAVADSFKAMVDEIGEGKVAVFIDEELGKLMPNATQSNLFVLKAKENFVADVVQIEKHEIMNEFLTTIGINNANMTKREREVVDEVNSNNIAIRANIKVFKQNVERCVEKVNKMFPDAGLKITFPYYEESEEQDREQPADRPDNDEKGGDTDDVT